MATLKHSTLIVMESHEVAVDTPAIVAFDCPIMNCREVASNHTTVIENFVLFGQVQDTKRG